MEETVNVVPPLPQGSGEAATAGGLRSNSLAAASAPPLVACEGALDGRPNSCRCASRATADGGYSTGMAAPGAGRQEACGADDATPSIISTSSSRLVCSTTWTMETNK